MEGITFKITGQLLKINVEDIYTDLPFVKTEVTLKYPSGIYSWNKDKWINATNEITFTHMITKFQVEKDVLYSKLHELSIEAERHATLLLEICFYIESKTSKRGYRGTTLKINSFKIIGDETFSPDPEYDDPA